MSNSERERCKVTGSKREGSKMRRIEKGDGKEIYEEARAKETCENGSTERQGLETVFEDTAEKPGSVPRISDLFFLLLPISYYVLYKPH
jgi:hypothetical protein